MSKAAAKKVENVEIELPVVPNPWAPTKPQSGQNDGPYFDKGHYLVEITAAFHQVQLANFHHGLHLGHRPFYFLLVYRFKLRI